MSERTPTRPLAPLLAAALAILIGVIAGRAGAGPAWGTAIGLAIAASLLAWRWQHAAQAVALVALAALAAERAGSEPENLRSPAGPLVLEACVENLVESDGNVPAWTGLAWTRDEAGGSRRLRLILATQDGPPPEPGTRLRLRGSIRAALPAKNPGEDDPRRLEADLGLDGGVWATAWTAVGRCDGYAAAALLARGRRAFAALVQSSLPPEEAGLALALTAGDASHVAPADFDAFQATGTVHVLSVSGMHLTLVTWMVFALVQGMVLIAGGARASAWDVRAAAAIAALAAAALYAGFAGLSLATARALVGTSLMCAAALAGGKSSAWNAWALGIAVLLLAGPAAVRTPTFALSFLAVAGMLAAGSGPPAPRFKLAGTGKGNAWLGWGRSIASWLGGKARHWPAETARMTAGAAAATAPPVAVWFGRVPAMGLVANAAAIPLFSAALVPLLMAAVVLPFSEPAARVLVTSAWPWLAAGRAVVAALAALPMCWLDVSLSAPGAAGLSAAVFAVLLLRGPVRAAAVIGGVAVAIAAAVVPPRLPENMEVTFLSVGQGDASVVRFANGGIVLVDTGPERAGRRVIVPFLRSLGVRRIDAIAISHAHPDHTGGLADILRAFPVAELWLAGPVGGDSGLDAAVAPLAARHTRVVQVGTGAASRAFGEARIDFLAGEASERPDKRNDRSVVLRASDPRWSVLFSGDLERAGEDRLVASGAGLASDVVKTPHHGSSTSSTTAFIRASAPRLAIAQTGLGNRFGFPHADVVARWRAAGSGWMDTAQEGAITVWACDRAICASSFVDPHRPVGY